ncbi:aldose epimerase family protein [Longimicrobium sp.]|uniref:aldose epimerase family protein n=1 Tax=Longimicrobium sp. TaxID=2029185 RepID=UPI002CBD91C6|nr:aldose epimerase family protein [Longimicrobium sp.]HSU16589.1 aldose epimerase family protein [Longimicrobium sp.]
MKITRAHVGTTRGHAGQGPTAVDAYTLDAGPALCVTVWTYGATLVETLVPGRDAERQNVTVRLPDLDAYEDRTRNPYVGATMGRFSRCIARGRLRIGGREHRLDRNVGEHHFHGGSIGFDRYVWQAGAERAGDELVLRLSLESADGDQGYPGALSAQVQYRVHADGRLAFRYSARTTASTVVGLTNHAYWNLAGKDGIDGHRLSVNAGRVVGVDGALIPAGPLLQTAGTPLDFRVPRQIGRLELDHCYALDHAGPAAELHDRASGRTMRVQTDQPALAVYSGEGLRPPRAGLCLQATALPDAPNRPDFPSARLEPGECYRQETVHHFFVG